MKRLEYLGQIPFPEKGDYKECQSEIDRAEMNEQLNKNQ